jgi:hypothetical protein
MELANWAPILHFHPEQLPDFVRWIENQDETPTFPREWLVLLAQQEPGVAMYVSGRLLIERLVIDVHHTLYELTFPCDSVRCPGGHYEVYEFEQSGPQRTISIISRTPFGHFARTLEGIEGGRLRRCPVCNKIFYAVRVTKPACSSKCASTLRVRQHRSAAYRKNRKRNRRAREYQQRTRAAENVLEI